jgi:hypothetical protein
MEMIRCTLPKRIVQRSSRGRGETLLNRSIANEFALGHSPLMSAIASRSTRFSLKQVMMHAAYLVRRPKKAAFFIHGMQREFSFLLQEVA